MRWTPLPYWIFYKPSPQHEKYNYAAIKGTMINPYRAEFTLGTVKCNRICFYHIATLIWHRKSPSFLIERSGRTPFILDDCQYRGVWRPGNVDGEDIRDPLVLTKCIQIILVSAPDRLNHDKLPCLMVSVIRYVLKYHTDPSNIH